MVRRRLLAAVPLVALLVVAPVAAGFPTIARAAPPSPSASYVVAAAPPQRLGNPADVIGFTSAPLPNVDLRAPLGIDSNSRQASLKPKLYQPKNAFHGDGYIWGSTVQTDEEKHLKPTPGVNLSVPLD